MNWNHIKRVHRLTKRKGHDSLVDYDGDEDGHELSQLLLESDRQAFEERVEGQGHNQEDSPKGRVVEDVRAVTVLVLKCDNGYMKI